MTGLLDNIDFSKLSDAKPETPLERLAGDAELDRVIALGQNAEARKVQAEWDKDMSDVLTETLGHRYEDTISQLYEEEMAAIGTKSAKSRECYTGRVKSYVKWCAEIDPPTTALPASAGLTASYLHHLLADKNASYSVMKQTAQALSWWHDLNDAPDPCRNILVRAIIRSAYRARKEGSNGHAQ
jgi:hypothetical protein